MTVVARGGKQRARHVHDRYFHFHLGGWGGVVVQIHGRSTDGDRGVHREDILLHIGVEHKHVGKASCKLHRLACCSAGNDEASVVAVLYRCRAESHRQRAARKTIPVGALLE